MIITKKFAAIIFGILFSGSTLANNFIGFQTKTVTSSQALSMLSTSAPSHKVNRKISLQEIYLYTFDDDEEHALPCNYGHAHCQCFDDHCVQQE